MDGNTAKARGDAAATVSLIASTVGVAWSLFWLFESFGELSSIWELIVPVVTITCGAVATGTAVVALGRGTSQRSMAMVGLVVGGALLAWGIGLVPVSSERVAAFVIAWL